MKFVQSILEMLVNIFFKIFFIILPHKKIDKRLSETIDLYKGDGFGELFVQIRAWDAPYQPVNKLIRMDAKVLDLGCGDGLLSNYLALTSSKRMVYGIDINKKRIVKAYKGIKNTKFEEGDILRAKIIQPDTIILAHVLHHLPSRDEQLKLLEKVARSLKKGNELIILEIDTKPFLKYLFTWFTDAFTVPILFEGKLFDFKFFYRKSYEWKKILTELNFDVKIKPVNKEMPFSHVLIYGKKLA